ncbi:PQQ-binding-like beta-propeller repeat protein [Spirillospora sp. CA-142024]|uniref:outer membrane protein assembly factor BamB family protein n=1 Tax=Spirillospora sp. CA-142024 TaxID=3240036 RepID=UPI003D948A48
MTADGDPPETPPSPARSRTVLTMRIEPDRPAPWRPSRRSLLISALVAAVAAATWGAVSLPGMLDDGMRGPDGAFPKPLAEEPPVHTARHVATSSGYGPFLVHGGLAIFGRRDFGDREDTRAVDIATGRTYWRFTKAAWPIGVDRSTGDVLVHGKDLTAINARTGRIHWSRPTPDNGADSALPVADAGTLVLLGRDGLTGVGRADGKTRWTKPWPDSCSEKRGGGDVDDVGLVVRGTVVVDCTDLLHGRNTSVVGFDGRTGATRWETRIPDLFPENTKKKPRGEIDWEPIGGIWEDRGRVAIGAGRSIALLDPADGRTLVHHTWKDDDPIALGSGVLISDCDAPKGTSRICGRDPDSGKKLWGTLLPKNELVFYTQSATVAGGRVYGMAATGEGRDRNGHLFILDARTGKRLGDVLLPGPQVGDIGEPVTDGVVTIRGDGGDLLYAERPDLQAPRELTPKTRS